MRNQRNERERKKMRTETWKRSDDPNIHVNQRYRKGQDNQISLFFIKKIEGSCKILVNNLFSGKIQYFLLFLILSFI